MYVAPDVPEDPITHELIRQTKRHYHQPEEKVSHSQRRNKPILNIFQRFLCHDRNNHQHIADDYCNHHYGNQNGRDNDVG